MEDEHPPEISFRAPKRRKVLRKAANTEDDEQSTLGASIEGGVISEQQLRDENLSSIGMLQARKRAGVVRGGIGFTSADTRRATGPEASEDRAPGPVLENGPSEVPNHDRFIKPTGRAEVVEDKHMTAYIDSKLAEARSTSDVLTKNAREHSNIGLLDDNSLTMDHDVREGPTEHPKSASAPTTFQAAQARTSRVYQRPTKRKPPPARPETDVARDSMIDQIMGENHVPHYAPAPVTNDAAEDAEVDHDAAAADAFKAQLLADMQLNRRRPAKSNATASTGPKLGGSRSAREKMKALEEAKASPSKK